MSRLFKTEYVDALDGALRQGLDDVVVLGQGRRDAGDKLGLSLGKPAANLGLPEVGELDRDGIDGVDLVGVVEDRVRAGGQRTGAGNQRARGQNHRARFLRHEAARAAAVTNFPLRSIHSTTRLRVVVGRSTL